MADNIEFLKHVRLFENLDRKSLEAIANAAVEQSYSPGQDIVRQGYTGVGAFILKKGRVEAVQDRGGRQHKLAELKTGDVFGEMALLDEFPRSATVRALEPIAQRLRRLDHPHLPKLRSQAPAAVPIMAVPG